MFHAGYPNGHRPAGCGRSGTTLGRVSSGTAAARDTDAVRFPQDGPGSVASFGSRIGAFIIDAVIADLVSILVLSGWKAGGEQNLVILGAFLLIELLFVWIAGQTPGMRAMGIAVVRVDTGGRQRFGWVLARTLLLAALVPALLPDSSGRCMHDRAAGTATIRTR